MAGIEYFLTGANLTNVYHVNVQNLSQMHSVE